MKQALFLAKHAGQNGDVPIGAVIVKDNKIIARGENYIQRKQNPLLHAETVAINRAVKKLGTKFLTDCDIYITLEPCSMCATAISFARIRNIYFATHDIKGGGILHNAKIYETDKHLWRPNFVLLSEYAPESCDLLQSFFKKLRNKQ